MAAGIETRHGPHGTRYRASVWSGQDGKLIRKTFTSMVEAKRWRVDAAQALQHGTPAPTVEPNRQGGRGGVDRRREGRHDPQPFRAPVQALHRPRI